MLPELIIPASLLDSMLAPAPIHFPRYSLSDRKTHMWSCHSPHKISQWLPMALRIKARILTRLRPPSACLWVQATQLRFSGAPSSPRLLTRGPLHRYPFRLEYFLCSCECLPVFRCYSLGKSGQAPSDPCSLSSQDFSLTGFIRL